LLCIEPVEIQHTAISSQGFSRNRILIGGLILYVRSFAVLLRKKSFDPTGAITVLALFGGRFRSTYSFYALAKLSA